MRSPVAGPILAASFFVLLAGCHRAETPSTGAADSPSATDTDTEPNVRPTVTVPEQPSVTARETAGVDATGKAPVAETAASVESAATEVTAAKITAPSSDSPLADEAEFPQPEQPEESSTLTIGDPAPPLSIAQWVTGEPIDSFDAGQLYVVEFWATWCGPCRTSMPHLSDLSTQLDDEVKIVGVTDEDVDTVEGFLDEEQSEGTTWRDVVTYRLAIDEDDATSNAYMKAAQQSGIPTAFIVGRDGVIEWIGHPMRMDQPLASVIDGTYDRSAAIAEFQQQQRLQKLSRQLSQLMRSGNFDEALELIDSVEGEPGKAPALLMTKLMLLQQAERHEEAAALRQQLVEQLWDNAGALNQIAWEVAIGGEPRDLDLALRAARQASELTDHANVSILDTLARVYYEQGDLAEAIVWQEKAAEHGGSFPQIQQTLEKYKAEQADADAGDAASPDDAASQPDDAASAASSDD